MFLHHVLAQCFFDLFRFHSPLTSIAAFPFTLLWKYGRCDNNHSTLNVYWCTTVFGIDFIHSMLSVMQQIGYDLSVLFDYRLSFAKCFFHFISTSAIWKVERRWGFSLAEGYTTNEWRGFNCLHKYVCCCLKNCEHLFGWMPWLFCKWLRSFEWGKNWFLYLK